MLYERCSSDTATTGGRQEHKNTYVDVVWYGIAWFGDDTTGFEGGRLVTFPGPDGGGVND